ncbi:50S ribosomal protein L1 [Candidatus Woesearchaeota archaeon]|nr:50S ribosomal protein L1 [Candidatus Woesearchaeota archaeon]
MKKQDIVKTLEQAKKNSPKRNFKQSVDLIINLKDLDLKKPEHNVNMPVTLHYPSGKQVSVCALVGQELQAKAKEVCNETILATEFAKFKDKKAMKQLADKHDFFIAQASVMPQIATTFGRVFGPRGKMPNPKVGAVLPPNANVKPLCDKLSKTVTVATKEEPVVKCMVGKEDTKEEELIDNILTVYNTVIQKLPSEHNIKNAMLKLTMGPAFRIGNVEKEESKENSVDKKESKAKAPKDALEKKEVKKESPKKVEEPKEEVKKEIKE